MKVAKLETGATQLQQQRPKGPPSILERLPSEVWAHHLAPYLDLADWGRLAITKHGGLGCFLPTDCQRAILKPHLDPHLPPALQDPRPPQEQIFRQLRIPNRMRRGVSATDVVDVPECIQVGWDKSCISPLADRAVYYSSKTKAFGLLKFGDGEPSCEAIPFAKTVTGEQRRDLSDSPDCVRWSADGSRPELYISAHPVRLWPISNGTMLPPVPLKRIFVSCAPSGGFLVLNNPKDTKQIEIWSTGTATTQPVLLGTLIDSCNSPWKYGRVDFSADEKLFAFSVENRIEVRQVEAGLPLVAQTAVYDGAVNPAAEQARSYMGLHFSPDNKLLLSFETKEPFRLKELLDQDATAPRHWPANAYVINGNALEAVPNPDIGLLQREDGAGMCRYIFSKVHVMSTAERQPGAKIVAANGDERVSLLQVGPDGITHAEQWPDGLLGTEGAPGDPVLAPNRQQTRLVRMNQGGIALWDLQTGKVKTQPTPWTEGAWAWNAPWYRWSPDGSRLTVLSALLSVERTEYRLVTLDFSKLPHEPARFAQPAQPAPSGFYTSFAEKFRNTDKLVPQDLPPDATYRRYTFVTKDATKK